MRKYECVLLFNPDLDENTFSEEIASITDLIKQYGGEVASTSTPKKVDIGYVIRKKKTGTYVLVNFNLGPEKVNTLKKALGLKESLLRYTIIVVEKKETLV